MSHDHSLHVPPRLCWIVLVLLGVHRPAAAQEAPAYPDARRVDHVDTYHGVQVADPYRWMEDLEAPELHDWLLAQDTLRADLLTNQAALVDYFRQRIAALTHYATRSLPVIQGPYTFFTQTEAGQSFGTLYVQQEGQGTPHRLLDLEALNTDGRTVRVNTYSTDGRFFTTITSDNQSRWMTLRVFRTTDGTSPADTITGYYSGASTVAWSGDGFYYSRYDVPDDPQAPLGTARIFFHRVGTPQSDDVLIYERPGEPDLSYTLQVSHDGRYLLISAADDGGSFTGLAARLFYKDLDETNGAVTELFAGSPAAYAYEGNIGTRFWIRTDHEAPQARLVAVDITRPDQWDELIPASADPMQAVSVVGDRFVVQYLTDARMVARIYDRQGRLQHEIDPVAPSIYGFADAPDRPVTTFGIARLHDPGSLFRLNVYTGATEAIFRPRLAHDPDAFVMKQVFYESTDGTRVPMFLVHRNDLTLDGTHPAFLYAYGVWSWSAYPWQRHLIPWLELGGVYAVPNIRGGGEYGEAWHRAGIRRNKQTGIDDFLAAADWLVANGYTSPERLVANGGSASGVLPAAGMIQRPDLFGAAVINFPALDMLRFTEFGSARSWIPEFGDPNDPQDFEALYAYSPYHHLAEGACYPPTWIQVGENDDTTTPMHGYKFAAALQAAQGCANPVVLKITWGAGHSYGLTPEQRWTTQAEELAFLVEVLGLDVKPTTAGR